MSPITKVITPLVYQLARAMRPNDYKNPNHIAAFVEIHKIAIDCLKKAKNPYITKFQVHSMVSATFRKVAREQRDWRPKDLTRFFDHVRRARRRSSGKNLPPKLTAQQRVQNSKSPTRAAYKKELHTALTAEAKCYRAEGNNILKMQPADLAPCLWEARQRVEQQFPDHKPSTHRLYYKEALEDIFASIGYPLKLRQTIYTALKHHATIKQKPTSLQARYHHNTTCVNCQHPIDPTKDNAFAKFNGDLLCKDCLPVSV